LRKNVDIFEEVSPPDIEASGSVRTKRFAFMK